ncbi:MAG TPA: enoyl-CoA hydratase-related protein, partial [Terriglobia bacterium]|nr:enoyl-CoA hydratase-related protein [Terriglobia bacterium]
MRYETLLCEIREGIGYVTLSRPDKLNALNRAMLSELSACFEELRHDESVGAVILTGAGDRAFAAGADVSELSECDAPCGKEASERGQRVFRAIEELGKPVIAAVRGYALGGGCELALASTLRVASESARFGLPEVKLGLIPGYGGTQRLARLVGMGRALEMILTGEPLTAAEAYRIGLVNRVVPEDELIPAARLLAQRIISNAPLAVRYALEAVRHGMQLTEREGENLEATLFGGACATADMKEGTRAFLEKRPP